MRALPHSGRVTASHIHKALGGRFKLMDIEAELIAMDLDGVIVNDMVPQARITQKGRKARKLKHKGTQGTAREFDKAVSELVHIERKLKQARTGA